MPKKEGIIGVKTEERLKWLQAYEAGESIFKIASDSDRDHRTVKKHIEIARTEKELKDERSIVLRNALERHFGDLLRIVQTILTRINSDETVEFAGDDEFLSGALRDHIPRSPIWNLLRRWNSCVQDIGQIKKQMEKEVEVTLAGDARLTAINERTSVQLFRGITALLMFKIEERSKGYSGLDVKSLEKEKRQGGVFSVSYGFAELGELGEDDLKVVQPVLTRIEGNLQDSEEFTELKDQYLKLADTRTKLGKELQVMKWKRIVPGRCRICPI